MSLHSLRVVQNIPIPVNQAWDFFSKPCNLQLITPVNFQFRILTTLDEGPIYKGQIIDYTVRPLFNIRVQWRTVITQVEQQVLFVDEQARGPFRYWQHQHHFKPNETGTQMTDVVNYEIPGWFLGDIINAALIKNDLHKLFTFRSDQIKKLFG